MTLSIRKTLSTSDELWTDWSVSVFVCFDDICCPTIWLLSLNADLLWWLILTNEPAAFFQCSCWPIKWLLYSSVCFLWWLVLTNEPAALFQCSFTLITHVDQWTGCSLSVFVSSDDSCWPMNWLLSFSVCPSSVCFPWWLMLTSKLASPSQPSLTNPWSGWRWERHGKCSDSLWPLLTSPRL